MLILKPAECFFNSSCLKTNREPSNFLWVPVQKDFHGLLQKDFHDLLQKKIPWLQEVFLDPLEQEGEREATSTFFKDGIRKVIKRDL